MSARDLPQVLARAGDSCVWGPEHFRDENWDLTFAKLEKHGVQIELAEAEGARYYSPSAGRWLNQDIVFNASEKRVAFGVELEIMPKDQLVEYKRALDRAVDRLDLAEIADSTRRHHP
ncbi:MAG: hypothetical protein WEA34_09945 [Gemmatimonadota bacterium]